MNTRYIVTLLLVMGFCNNALLAKDIPTANCAIVCPGNITASTNAGVCTAVVNYPAPIVSGNNCSSITQTEGMTSGSVFPVGSTTNTFQIVDNDTGESISCSFVVIVVDNESPTVNCQDITVQLDATGNVSIAATDIDDGSSDACGIGSRSLNQTSFDCNDVGTINTVTLTVTDVNGNSSNCNVTVTVEDNVNPQASCKNITVQLDDTGNVTIAENAVDNGSLNICGGLIYDTDTTTFNCDNIGSNTVTLTVTDANGNSSNCTAEVTVEDKTAPTAICQNITKSLKNNGTASITILEINNGSNDICSSVTTTLDKMDFDCDDIGANTVTLTVTDASGNTSTCEAEVTIEDNTNPTAICRDTIIQLDASGNVSIRAVDIDNGSSDICGIDTLILSQMDFTCNEVGGNAVTLTVRDNNGNEETCISTVTVRDTIKPTVACQNITIQLDRDGNATIATTDIDNGSTDACGIASLSLDNRTFDCTDVGTNSVVLTVTDNNGNVATCTATVTVEDDIVPVANCNDITIQLDANGNATITTSDIDNGSNDACGIDKLNLSQTTFDCNNIGSNTVTLTVSDVNGNESTCTSTVTVQDIVAPNAICQDITIQLDANGNASITTTDIDNGSSDKCGIASLSLDKTSFNCNDIGTNTVILTVTDNNGNRDNCPATVTMEDNILPTAICQNITVELDASGNASITENMVDNGSFDNCVGLTYDTDITTFDCTDVGNTNTVTLTIKDDNNNESTCTPTVTVVDNVAPTTICRNITISLDASGNASITTSDINNGSNDACGVNSLSLSQTDFDCDDVGTNTVTLIVTDVNGNSSTCTAIVTVVDNIAPTANCKNIVVQLDATGNVSITEDAVDDGSSDICGGLTFDTNITSFNCNNIGNNPVVLEVKDASGNSSICSDAIVIVEDNVAPTAICQDITIQLDALGNASITTTDIDNGSNDACGIASLSLNQTSFDCSNIGANTVTLTVTDVNGNSSACNATVTVEDNINPTTICQNVILQLDALGNASITTTDIDNGSNDACGIASLSLSQTSFDCSHVGTNTIILTTTDSNGNSSTCEATVIVEDNVAPIAICQDITIQLDATGNGFITENAVNNGSSDNCIGLVYDTNKTTFDCTDVGSSNMVTLILTDNNDNVSTCQATVTVEDNIAPIANCKDITVQLDSNGNASITTTDIDNGSTDACGIASLSLDKTTFDCTNIGTANIVTLTVTDNNGNISTCTSTVTVEDNVAPTAICQDIMIELDANGNASITTTEIDNGSTDACGIASISLDKTTFDCSDIGSNTVILTVMDDNGNISNCTATVTVQDNISPVVSCQDITIQLDATGNAIITPASIDNGSTDACGIASLSLDKTTFDCTNIGMSNIVTLTATDNNGNISTCTATVIVEDTTAPTAICQNIIIQLDTNGNASITTTDIDNGSNDACGIASLSLDKTIFDCTNVGITNIVTLTVTDNNNNVSTCDATVTVEDNIPPSAICKDITIQLDATGNAIITEDAVNNGSSDTCGNLTFDTNITSFDCTDVGTSNIVTLNVTDANDNTSTCTATVTIEDNIAPTAICQNIIVELDATGNASITTADIDNGSNDACGIASLSLDKTTFDCTDVGTTNAITLTVTDNNGNTSTCTSMVTIQDNINPNAVCQDITVQLDATGNVSIAEDAVDNGSSDACGGLTYDTDMTSFDCDDLGTNLVSMAITDTNGNSSVCNAIVTVQDNINPIANCKNITVELDATGNVNINPEEMDNGSSDNCGIASLALDITTFDCTNIGDNPVILTVTDNSGNQSTCNATVTVEDNTNPIVICQNIIVQLDATGNTTITATDINNGSNDACNTTTLSLDITSFDCTDVGNNLVTLTATDNDGNSSTCNAIVTVQDIEVPTVICQNITNQLDSTGNVSITITDIDNGTNDACGITTLVLDETSFDCTNIGENTVTLIAIDNHDNIATCTASVIIEDNINPTAICQDMTVQLDSTGNVLITTTDIDNGSNDACGIASLTLDMTSFDCTNIGTEIVMMSVIDNNGNSSTCTSTITIEDNIAPTAICQDLTVVLDATGNTIITTAQIDNGSNDACGIASLSLNKTDFDCDDIGENTVVLTVTDNNGNISICIATVTVEDNIDPIANCQDITIQLDETGNATITENAIDNGSSHVCGGLIYDTNITSFDCTNIGMNTVVLTVTNNSGNSVTCTSIVTVEDNTAPEIICQDITIQLDATGNAIITEDAIDNGSSDACGSLTYDTDITTFDCDDVGLNLVTLIVTDANGNSSTCTAGVTVEEIINPILSNCPTDITQTSCESIVTWTNPTASDNCSGFVLTSTHDSGDTFPTGTTTVTYTLTDASGNEATCSFDVTITGTDVVDDIIVIENSGNIANDGIICTGDDATLDAGTHPAYLWSTNETSQTISITQGGTYTVTITNVDACTSSKELTIIENALPNPTITISETSGTANDDAVICQDDDAILDAGLFTSYLWSTNETTQTITINVAGNYTVSVTDENGCMNTGTVTINASGITPIIAPVDVCEDDFGTGSAIVNLENYQLGITGSPTWFIDAGLTNPVDDPTNVTVFTNASYYAVVSGCIAEEVIFTVNPQPSVNSIIVTITGDSETIDLTNSQSQINNSSGVSFEWFDGAGQPINVSIDKTVFNEDVFEVVVTDDVTSCTNTALVTFNNNTVNISNTTGDFCQGGDLTILGTGFLGDSITVEFTGSSVSSIFSNDTDVLMTVPIPSDAMSGPMIVTVTNNGETESATYNQEILTNASIEVDALVETAVRFCVNDVSEHPFSGIPTGGTFSWTGDGTFDESFVPADYFPGTYTVTYNPNCGIINPTTLSITIDDIVSSIETDSFFTIGESLGQSDITLLGITGDELPWPESGTVILAGSSSSTSFDFDNNNPLVIPTTGLPAGDYTLSLQGYTDVNNCFVNNMSTNLTLVESPIEGLLDGYCSNFGIVSIVRDIINNSNGFFPESTYPLMTVTDPMGVTTVIPSGGMYSFDTNTLPADSYSITVSYSGGLGGTETITQDFDIHPLPPEPLVNNVLSTSYCFDDDIFLMLTNTDMVTLGGVALSIMEDGNALFTFADLNSTPVASGFNQYDLVLTNTNDLGCDTTKTYQIEVLPDIDLTTNNPELSSSVCNNATPILLNHNGNNGTFYYQEEGGNPIPISTMSFDPSLIDVNIDPVNIVFTYDLEDCTYDIDTLTIKPIPNIDISGNDVTYCVDVNVTLITNQEQGEGTTEFLLLDMNDNLVTAAAGLPQIIEGNDFYPSRLDSLGNYQLVCNYTNNGCTGRDTLVIEVLTGIFLDLQSILGSNPYCLNDDEVELPELIDAGIATWAIETANVTNLFQEFFVPDETGEYNIIYFYTDDNGCDVTADTMITVHSLPDPIFTQSGFCEGDTLIFTGNSNITGVDTSGWDWTWTYNNSLIYDDNAVFEISTPVFGNQNIELIVTDLNGCQGEITTSDLTTVPTYGQIPTGEIKEAPSVCEGSSISFELVIDALSNAEFVNYVEWNFGGITQSNTILENPQGEQSLIQTYNSPAISGSYPVQAIMTTNDNCSKVVSLEVAVVGIGAVDGTCEDFSVDNGGWVTHDDDFWKRDGNADIPDANECWYTEKDGNTYASDKRAWVYSPCYDLTNMERPMLSMDVWYETDENFDGAVIEYYDNVSSGWKVLGIRERGLNWYNSIVTILPTSSSLFPVGWSGNSDGWETVRYKLDEIKNSPNASNAHFRIAFASDANIFGETNKGFAFDNVCVKEREKTVFIEHFVNGHNADMSDVRSDFYDKMSIDGQIASDFDFNVRDALTIQYHTAFPDYDYYNQSNPTDPSARVLYYGVNEVKKAVVQGNDLVLTESINQTQIDTIILQDAKFDITINNLAIDLGGPSSIEVTVTPNSTISTDDDIVVYVALVEYKVSPFGNDNISHQAVLRKMAPNAGGILLDDNLELNNEEISFSFPSTTIVNPDFMEAVVFVQNKNTKEIYNAVSTRDVNSITVSTENIQEESSIKVYPNPTTGILHVEIETGLPNHNQYHILDISGKQIMSNRIQFGNNQFQIPMDKLPNGLYFLLIEGNEGILYRQKVMVMH